MAHAKASEVFGGRGAEVRKIGSSFRLRTLVVCETLGLLELRVGRNPLDDSDISESSRCYCRFEVIEHFRVYVMKIEKAGKELTCAHCGGKDFESGTALLNTAWMSFLNLDCLDKSADTYVCKKCGRIE